MKEFALLLTLFSHHFLERREFNETNPGAGIEYRLNRNTFVGGGAYFNSNRKWSTYSTLRWQWKCVGLEFGGATGYRYPIIPLAFAYVMVGPVKVNVLPSKRPIVGVQVRVW